MSESADNTQDTQKRTVQEVKIKPMNTITCCHHMTLEVTCTEV